MIKESFIFLPGIGLRKEKQLWQQGIKNWQDFLNAGKIKGISVKAKKYYDTLIRKAEKALLCRDASYFAALLPSTETWRLYSTFKEDAVFLDIETTGTGNNARIVVFGMYDGIETKQMIYGCNLDFEVIKKTLSSYKLIITYNGSSFDLPFIKKRYPLLLPKAPHIDLRHV